jgi:hypothetical protein
LALARRSRLSSEADATTSGQHNQQHGAGYPVR